MLRAVVFDVGETLVNESRLWRMWAEWLGVPDHVVFALLGASIACKEEHLPILQLLRPGFDLELAREERRRLGNPDEFDGSDLYPDVAPCIHALHMRGLRIGIAGNQPVVAEQALESLGLPVEFVAASERWKAKKPAPEFFQKIIGELELAAGEIAYVGDRLDNDILPTLSAGMVAVFIRRGPWGFLHARLPDIAKAHVRVENLTELPDALVRARLIA
ncbi:MAG TPA: HAD family hydrolase [Bryobacteraceae bacterium]|nr:HAD family hydrolase [Bryobacteraceae bacterium]